MGEAGLASCPARLLHVYCQTNACVCSHGCCSIHPGSNPHIIPPPPLPHTEQLEEKQQERVAAQVDRAREAGGPPAEK